MVNLDFKNVGEIKDMKPCCGEHYLSAGYVWKQKNEIYFCKHCGKVYFSPGVGKLKRWLIKKFALHYEMYDESQVRVYFPLNKPTLVADLTGEKIRELEEGLKECEKV